MVSFLWISCGIVVALVAPCVHILTVSFEPFCV
jgi:hypothetical protein